MGLPEDRSSHAIVRAITGLSDGLGVITTAEGVETEGQLAAVLALGCTQVQGYLVSKPVTNQALLQLFADHDASAFGRQGQSGRQRDGDDIGVQPTALRRNARATADQPNSRPANSFCPI